MEIADLVRRKLAESGRLLVTLDGPCASGKTTYAGRLGAALGARVIHTDDFVVPRARKTAERLAVPGGNCDAERLVQEVLTPWSRGAAVTYRRYDCAGDCLVPEEEAVFGPLLILEGSYCNLTAIRTFAGLRLWLDTPARVREERLAARESAASLRQFRALWIPLEEAYFRAYGLPDGECLRLGSVVEDDDPGMPG